MRHLLFPTVAQADAFVADLKAQNLVREDMGQATLNRGSMGGTLGDAGVGATTSGTDHGVAHGGGTAEDAGAGAVKGTGVGAVVGAVAGAAATVATGGLATIPLILGWAALGSGVGAGVGATGGALGVDETGDGNRAYDSDTTRTYHSDITDAQHDRLYAGESSGGRAIAVDDSVPLEAVEAAAARHGGEFI